ncbi:MAG TPA: alpha/beta fold hydrolase [Alloacidobacterium sp.]|nr:alpha/beta fold hydrolase [Alloacidobacterium sp.]
MRFAGLRKCCWLLFICAGCVIAQTGSTTSNSSFSLELAGKSIGNAEYSLLREAQDFHLQGSYTFTTKGVAVKCSREADLDTSYGLRKDILTVHAGGVDEDVTVTVDPAAEKFVYQLKSSVQQIEETKDLHPGTVVLNNFDPSGVQHLVWLAKSHPASEGKYWALLAQGKGVYLPIQLTSAEAGKGKLNEQEILLQHWRLAISGIDAEIWADSQDSLMEFAVPAQQLAYRRVGFVLEQAAQPPSGENSVEERRLSFLSDGLKFPAILTLPKTRTSPIPVVVMVQGSGPQDADETIGPNKPFRDIALGLGAAGIATLRYDKRTHFAPQAFEAHPDLDHEVTLDAVAALQFVSGLPEIDRRRIFLLGHSLGGTMAPAIAKAFLAGGKGSVRGLILMAAGAVSIDKTIERQAAFQARLHGASPATLDQLQKQWEDIFVTVNDKNMLPDRVLGIGALQLPAAYWRTWLQQDPSATLAKLGLPALVMRGVEDVQVSEEDFNRLQHANLAPGSEGVQIDGLNHLFMPVKSKSTGDEYLQPGQVSPDAIKLISQWIQILH